MGEALKEFGAQETQKAAELATQLVMAGKINTSSDLFKKLINWIDQRLP